MTQEETKKLLLEKPLIINHNSDIGGCNFYRMETPAKLFNNQNPYCSFLTCRHVLQLDYLYRKTRLVRWQRPFTIDNAKFFFNYLKPKSIEEGFLINYESDDPITTEALPKYNGCREAYANKETQRVIKDIMTACDIVTVSTQPLADHYIDIFGAHKESMNVIPNFLPRWWMSTIYNFKQIEERYDSLKIRKPVICFPMSMSHFNHGEDQSIPDDFKHLEEFVRTKNNKYDFVFVGGYPKYLEDLLKDKKIKAHPGFDIYNYPRELSEQINPDIIVAPLINNTFNLCKSNIKYLEASALGIPGIFQNLPTYSKYTKSLFNDANDLQNKIDNILSRKSLYMDTVKFNRNIIDHGDKANPNGWWLEKNMGYYNGLFNAVREGIKFVPEQIIEVE